MSGTEHLMKARIAKNDEFYTQYETVEAEMKNYKAHLKNKYIFCNCDGLESSFWKYFVNNYDEFELKHLTAIQYDEEGGKRYDYDGCSVSSSLLEGNGSFDSEESKAVLAECDVVITNPPFSLIRKFFTTLLEYDKDFIFIGTVLFTAFQCVIPSVMNGKLKCGYNECIKELYEVPKEYKEKYAKKIKEIDGKYYININNTTWFTSFDRDDKPFLELTKSYNEKDYPKYDNADAIEVKRTKNIPKDYYGIMGVPVTFFQKYNKDQFEILGFSCYNNKEIGIFNTRDLYLNGKVLFQRIFIRRKI